MRKNSLTLIALLMAVCVLMPFKASAFPTSKFASNSRLASGQWVKIAVANSGIYEISSEELLEMGFSQPENVAVYGRGGYAISEVLDNNTPDDLQPVGSLWQNGKLYFYGKGVVELSMANISPVGTTFERTRNPYSMAGYYFLTQEENPLRVNISANNLPSSYTPITSSLNCWFHESELSSVSNSGKDLLGEDILMNSVMIPYKLEQLSDRTIGVGVRAACATTGNTYLVGYLCYDGQTRDVGFSIGDGKFYPVTDKEWFYDVIMPYSSTTLTSLTEEGELKLLINNVGSSSPTVAKVDHAIISYKRLNAFADAQQGSFDMWYSSLKPLDVIQLTDVDADVMVWDVGSYNVPVGYTPQIVDESTYITLGRNIENAHLTVFSPSRTQMKIDGYERIENQNLHSLVTPDMLIVTCSPLMEQAKRVAQLHKEHDGMIVEVVDQQQVFNEFSSGTPDAMAIRLLCKMLYDRNPAKFKNLLLFGTGAFDNRGIVQHKSNTVITYESDDSRDKVSSYPCDDFYGMLDDGSGALLEAAQLRLGVGRIPSATVQEAKSDVDKLVSYVLSPDYGVWRNNYLLMADEGIIQPNPSQGNPGDIGLHVWQAEGVNTLIENATQAMHSNKVYVETFPRDASETSITLNKRTCTDARKHIIESLNSGQYFMTYVGHAGGSVMAGNSKLWRSSDVLSNNYSHMPIMSTACCNVARYDSDSRGIAEVMFHYPKGGVIALLTPARDVYAKYNDLLNRAFVNGMFSTDNNGNMPTLGEAYMKAKLSFGRVANYNKMSYFLMGDPAIKINFPRPLFAITSIAGEAPTDTITLSPMQRVTVEAQVRNRNGSGIDDSFTGNATVTLYGSSKYFTSYTKQSEETGWNEKRDICLERPMLAQVESHVENGHMTATMLIPRYELDEGSLQLSVYAHKEGTDEMVNGVYNKLKLGDYDEDVAQVDTESPVITAMYLNDEESFASNNVVSTNSILYVTVTDDLGINMMKNSPGQSMRLALDGNKEMFYTVKDYAVCSDDGRAVSVAFPLSGLKLGQHTLTYTVFDMEGNSAQQTISFLVGQLDGIALDVLEAPVSTQATFDLAENTLSVIPQVDLKVADAQGNLVWKTTTSQFPVVWDLKGLDGQRVPAGLYKFFGTYRSGSNYGGTDINDFIIINPLQ